MHMAKVQSAPLPLDNPRDSTAEVQLITAAKHGDQQAFEHLVRLYDRTVLRIALQILRSPEDASDAYQETFLKVYRKLDSFKYQCRFNTWLHRVATNVCLDMLRRKKARKEVPSTYADNFENPVQSPFLNAADNKPTSSPERVSSSREISNRIELAINTLSDKERMVFTLRHYEGMRLRAIGEACSMSEKAAKNCLFRATRKLRKELQDVHI